MNKKNEKVARAERMKYISRKLLDDPNGIIFTLKAQTQTPYIIYDEKWYLSKLELKFHPIKYIFTCIQLTYN